MKLKKKEEEEEEERKRERVKRKGFFCGKRLSRKGKAHLRLHGVSGLTGRLVT